MSKHDLQAFWMSVLTDLRNRVLKDVFSEFIPFLDLRRGDVPGLRRGDQKGDLLDERDRVPQRPLRAGQSRPASTFPPSRPR